MDTDPWVVFQVKNGAWTQAGLQVLREGSPSRVDHPAASSLHLYHLTHLRGDPGAQRGSGGHGAHSWQVRTRAQGPPSCCTI